MTGPRRLGLALLGVLGVVLAIASGTAFASSGSPSAGTGMAGMSPGWGGGHVYVVVPLGFTPPRSSLACPVAGHCIDHPSTIDLSAVLGSGTFDVLLPAHSHIVATANHQQPEWWNVDVVAVKNLAAWNKIVHAKSDRELEYLQRTDSSAVTGNITSNLFLYFAVKTGTWCHSIICLPPRS